MSSKFDNHIFTNPSERLVAEGCERAGKIQALADYLGVEFYEELETGKIIAMKKENSK